MATPNPTFKESQDVPMKDAGDESINLTIELDNNALAFVEQCKNDAALFTPPNLIKFADYMKQIWKGAKKADTILLDPMESVVGWEHQNTILDKMDDPALTRFERRWYRRQFFVRHTTIAQTEDWCWDSYVPEREMIAKALVVPMLEGAMEEVRERAGVGNATLSSEMVPNKEWREPLRHIMRVRDEICGYDKWDGGVEFKDEREIILARIKYGW